MIFLDLGCGIRKKQGYIGIDLAKVKGVDIVCNIDKGLSIKDSCVDGIYSCFFFEHVRDLITAFQEVYRVCKNGAIMELIVPYYASINAFKDPTHKQFFTEETFRYFSQEKWYGSDYNINTNFQLINIKYHYSNLIKWLPFKRYLRRYFFNVVGAMEVKLKVIK